MSPRFQWWYPNLVEWLMRKANDSVWYFRTSALLLTTVHPQLFTTVHCSPREPSEQKHFAVPNWWHQQGIWEDLRALKITGNYYMECYLNSIIWDSIDIFLSDQPYCALEVRIPLVAPVRANSEHFSSLRDRPRKTKPLISKSIACLLLSLEFHFHVWRIILSLTLATSRERGLPNLEWPCLLGLKPLP